MDVHAHTAIGRVIHELYNNSDEKSEEPAKEAIPETDSIPKHISISDAANIPKYIPSNFLESQLVRNIIQSYRVEFGTKGNGDPTGYGYEILESDHATKYNNVFKMVILYKNVHERNRIRSYVNTITLLGKRHKWFHEIMGFIYQDIYHLQENELCYITFDSYSTDNLHHPRINYDPYDESLGKLIENPFYRIVSFDEWRTQMLSEAHHMSVELRSSKWMPWWTHEWKVRYVLRQLIRCITAHEEIEVTW